MLARWQPRSPGSAGLRTRSQTVEPFTMGSQPSFLHPGGWCWGCQPFFTNMRTDPRCSIKNEHRFLCCTSSDPASRLISTRQGRAEQRLAVPAHRSHARQHFLPVQEQAAPQGWQPPAVSPAPSPDLNFVAAVCLADLRDQCLVSRLRLTFLTAMYPFCPHVLILWILSFSSLQGADAPVCYV